VLNHAVEFVGEGVRALTIDQRMSIANMTTEWGALAGVFPFDEVTRDYLLSRAEYFAKGRRPGVRREGSLGVYTRADVEKWWAERSSLAPDAGASYAVELEIDLDSIVPHVSGPNDVKTMHALPEIEAKRVKINKAWLMSCVNARYEDLSAAAGIVRGKKVAPGVEFYLAAASAVAGYICSPTRYEDVAVRASEGSTHRVQSSDGAAAAVSVIEGFPAVVKGRAWFLDRDNLNTDGIYAGKHTYNDAMTPEQMSAVIFEDYDPDLRARMRPGDVVIGGLNFGTGSSREQAATALKYFGIPCVIAASFSETYKRNAFNNGFVCFECPEVVQSLRAPSASPGDGAAGATKSRLVGEIEIDYQKSSLTLNGKRFAFPALSPVAQDLVVAGGAENVIKRRLAGVGA
jgi:homoaconitate hydratase